MGAVLRSSVSLRPWPRVRIHSGEPRMLLPNAARVRGGNITVRPSGDWWRLWRDWEWTDWIKWQVDLLASIGGNTVRLMGTYKGRYQPQVDPPMDQTLYLDRWDQLATYVADLGMYLYPCCGGDFGGPYGYTPPTSFVADEAAAVAERLRDYPNIIGIDIVQERQSWAATDGLTPRNAVRAEIDVPLTYSHYVTSDAELANTTWRSQIDPVVDYFDIHINNHTPDSTAFTDDYWANQRKPLLIGEFGADQSLSTATQTARYNAIVTNVGLTPAYSGDTFKCAGALAWAITDQDTVSSNQWGMFDSTGTARTHLTGAFANLPT